MFRCPCCWRIVAGVTIDCCMKCKRFKNNGLATSDLTEEELRRQQVPTVPYSTHIEPQLLEDEKPRTRRTVNTEKSDCTTNYQVCLGKLYVWCYRFVLLG